MKKTIFFLFFLYSLSIFCGKNRGFGIGPAYGYDIQTEGHVLGLDISYTYELIFTLSLNPRVSINSDSDNTYFLDSQFTVWFFGNIGGGVGKHSEYGTVYHLFYGFPWGWGVGLQKPFLESIRPFKLLYIEPYYRVNFIDDNISHEVGIMIKINTMLMIVD